MPYPLWPEWITEADGPALDELAAAGAGEGDFGHDHEVPVDLLELYEVLEWEKAVAAAVEREAPGTGEPREGVDAPADGTWSPEIEGDGTGQALPPTMDLP